MKKAIVPGVVVALLGLVIGIIWFPLVPGLFFRVPSDIDRRLVGSWSATSSRGNRQVSFGADGSYLIEGLWRMQWGTKDGVLYVKGRSAGEGWDTGVASYRFTADGRTVIFSGKPSFMLPKQLVRRD